MFAITGFVISRLFSINMTITGEKKIVRYTEDFVIQRLVISRFHCTNLLTNDSIERTEM